MESHRLIVIMSRAESKMLSLRTFSNLMRLHQRRRRTAVY